MKSYPHIGHIPSPVRTALLVTVLPAALLAGCGGGGGGGDDFIGAGKVSISASPDEIDTGDRAEVQIRISDVYEGGVILKIKYPVELKYVTDSAVLEIGDEDIDLSPLTLVSDNDDTYLVFAIDSDWFEEDDSGRISFEVEGVESKKNTEIEVDPDVNRSEVPDNQEFNIDNPEFDAEDSVAVEISG